MVSRRFKKLCCSGFSTKTSDSAQKSRKQEEDESRKLNLMVFGLPEDASETDPAAEVALLLEELGEKPPISACTRLGAKTEGNTRPRPIMATLSSRESLLSILRKARDLRNSPNYSRVYLAPDRPPEERLERKRTLETVQKLRTENPERQYLIRGGVIECV